MQTKAHKVKSTKDKVDYVLSFFPFVEVLQELLSGF